MKSAILTIATAVFLSASLIAAEAPSLLPWTSSEGKTIEAEFVRLNGERLVIRKNGKELSIPMGKLSAASREKARELAANPGAGSDPDSAVAKSFGKQTDPEHQRTLAESILAKRGKVEIWRGSEHLFVWKAADLSEGKFELKSIQATGAPFTEEDAKLLNGCKELERLELVEASLDALPLESLKALKYLKLARCRIPAAGLAGLEGSKTLTEVAVEDSRTPVGARLIPILASCPNLEFVFLRRAGLGAAPIQPLSKLRLLRRLALGGNDYTSKQLACLADFRALNDLLLTDSDFAGDSLSFLTKLRPVSHLDLGGSKFAPSTLRIVAAMPGLTSLTLWGSNTTDDMLRNLEGHRNLRFLNLGATQVSGQCFTGMKPLLGLEVLNLELPKLQDSDAMVGALGVVCPNVTDLTINASHLGPEGYLKLGALRKLNRLNLIDAANVDEDSLTAIAKMKNITILTMARSKLNSALVPALESAKTHLVQLYLQDTRIDDTVLDTLEKFRSLTELNITNTDISRSGAERLRKALPACKVMY